jgi:hypothetical protein
MPIVIRSKQPNDEPYKLIYTNADEPIKVSPCDYDIIKQHTWYIKQSFSRAYAYTSYQVNNIKYYFAMHRMIMDPQGGEVVHHVNGDTLDNRRSNLLVMSEFDHIKRHSWR